MKYDLGKSNRLGNRTSNQDRFAILERPETVLLLLADGMGGHQGGGLAANTFIQKMTEVFRTAQLPIEDTGQFFSHAFDLAHQCVIDVGNNQNPPISPRSTGVACLVQDNKARWAHVGDSRLYLIREKKVLYQTRDHSVVEELIQKGTLLEKDRLNHPKSNQITRCVGGHKKVTKPDFSPEVLLQADDVLLLCSDGFWGALSSDEMIEQFDTGKNMAIALDEMSQHAENISYPNSDNITGIALHWISNEKTKVESDTEEQDTGSSVTTQADLVLDEIREALEKIERDLKR